MARRKECMTLSFSAETKERLRIFAEQNHKTVSQAITDWIWSVQLKAEKQAEKDQGDGHDSN